jgi:hypothetical protein
VYGRGVEDRALALAVAVDTTVQLPNGSMITGARGLSLPDGAVVRTGPNGHCAAGDVELGPGIEALVASGHLRLRPLTGAAQAAVPAATGGGSVTVPTTTATLGATAVREPPVTSGTTVTTVTTRNLPPTTVPVTVPAAVPALLGKGHRGSH